MCNVFGIVRIGDILWFSIFAEERAFFLAELTLYAFSGNDRKLSLEVFVHIEMTEILGDNLLFILSGYPETLP